MLPESPKIVSFKPPEMGFSTGKRGGKDDGVEFTMVEAVLENGKTEYLFRCNTMDGFFKQVFIPYGFKCPEIIDF